MDAVVLLRGQSANSSNFYPSELKEQEEPEDKADGWHNCKTTPTLLSLK